jgi:hypothetical protein
MVISRPASDAAPVHDRQILVPTPPERPKLFEYRSLQDYLRALRDEASSWEVLGTLSRIKWSVLYAAQADEKRKSWRPLPARWLGPLARYARGEEDQEDIDSPEEALRIASTVEHTYLAELARRPGLSDTELSASNTNLTRLRMVAATERMPPEQVATLIEDPLVSVLYGACQLRDFPDKPDADWFRRRLAVTTSDETIQQAWERFELLGWAEAAMADIPLYTPVDLPVDARVLHDRVLAEARTLQDELPADRRAFYSVVMPVGPDVVANLAGLTGEGLGHLMALMEDAGGPRTELVRIHLHSLAMTSSEVESGPDADVDRNPGVADQ